MKERTRDSEASIVRLHIDGIERFGGHVRVGLLINKLAALKESLVGIAQLGEKEEVDFFVSDLSHSSPVMIELCGVVRDRNGRANPESAARIVADFVNFLLKTNKRQIAPSAENHKIVEK